MKRLMEKLRLSRGRVWLLGSVLAVGLLVVLALVFWPRRGINVILITVDTLRADHLGVYGYAKPTSPNIDQFAREAILFRRAFSHSPETNPSLSALMTSHYPFETKVYSVFYTLAPGAHTMAEILKAQGYRTAGVISHDTLRQGSGFEQGFDEYNDRTEVLVAHGTRAERIATRTTRAAIEWLEGNFKSKFFLWVHYDDPHGPYIPPAPYDTMFVEPARPGAKRLPVNPWSGKGGIPAYQVLGDHREREYYVSQYDGEIRFLDESVGELIAKLRLLGLMENSLIIFTADHGEGMGEHDYYFSHYEFLYNELIHVPFILRLPGQAPPPRVVEERVGLVDVLPTILEILGLKAPRPLKGRSLLSPDAKREILAEAYRPELKTTLIAEDLKLILRKGHSELFDIRADFAEQSNLNKSGMDTALIARAFKMKERLDGMRREDALQLGKPILWSMPPETIKTLKSLGYVQ